MKVADGGKDLTSVHVRACVLFNLLCAVDVPFEFKTLIFMEADVNHLLFPICYS